MSPSSQPAAAPTAPRIDFLRVARIALVASAVAVLASVVSLVTRGLDLGIDFEGGTVWEVPVTDDVSVVDVRDDLRPLGLADARIQLLEAPDATRVRVQTGTVDDELQSQVTAALARTGGVEAGDVSVNEVGPSWGEEITASAQRALVFFFLAIAAYIAVRFEWKMAVAALVAVVHDIIITVGVYSLFGFEVTPATVIAFLTILGYSLYDTIVVFDKVRENQRLVAAGGSVTYSGMVNRSLNQVIGRSVTTTVTSLLPVVSLLVVGSWLLAAVTLQEFALALFVGLLIGAYSSVFVAAPVLAALKEREPRHAAVRARVAGRGDEMPARSVLRPRAANEAGDATPAAAARPQPADAPAATSTGGATSVARAEETVGRGTAATSLRTGQPPRGRKKGRRR